MADRGPTISQGVRALRRARGLIYYPGRRRSHRRPAPTDRGERADRSMPRMDRRRSGREPADPKRWPMGMANKLGAEFIGTFWLVLGGCGSAVLAAAFPNVDIGLLGVSFAFGLTVLTMAYAIGHISDCHLNPAVSVGLWSGGRFPASDLIPYIIAQVAGAIVGAGAVYVIASGKAG